MIRISIWRWVVSGCVLLLMGGIALPAPLVAAQLTARYFPQTDHTVRGRFLAYWLEHGGLEQFGYPISEVFLEAPEQPRGPQVQYFERAVLEYRPENTCTASEVTARLLGVSLYYVRYPGGAPGQHPSPNNPHLVSGRMIGGPFLAYWEQHGSYEQQGVPLSEEFQETNQRDGELYTVQYFAKAVFEWHPAYAGTPYEVLLKHLGTDAYRRAYGADPAAAVPHPPPPAEDPLPVVLLRGLDMVSAHEGWAVGDAGVLLHYQAERWAQVCGPTPRVLNSVHMLSADEGWAVGDKDILHYRGGRWEDSTPPDRLSYGGLAAVDMVSADDGWAVGSTAYGRGNDAVIRHYQHGQWEQISNAPPLAGGLSGLDMISPIEGWAVGASGILHYRAGVWQREPIPAEARPLSVAMLYAGEGWAVGYSGAILHDQAGRWDTVASPVTTTLSSVALVSATEGWAVGTGLVHYWHGVWSSIPLPVPAPVYLSAVAMVSADEGWAVGSGGTILHYRDGLWGPYTRDQ